MIRDKTVNVGRAICMSIYESMLNLIYLLTFLTILSQLHSALCLNRTCGNVPECHWHPWTAWTSCSATCGGGVRESRRVACCIYSYLDFWGCLHHCHLDRHDAQRLLPCANNTCPPTTTTTTTTTTPLPTTTLTSSGHGFVTGHGGIPGIDLSQAIDVVCGDGGWDISVLTTPLRQRYSDFKASDVYLGNERCNGTETGDKIHLHYNYIDCHTSEMTLTDRTVYSNTLVYAYHDPVYSFITREYRFKIKLHCYFDNPVGPLTQPSGQGSVVNVTLTFYNDSTLSSKRQLDDFTVGDEVYVMVTSLNGNNNQRMALQDCFLKPTKHSDSSMTYFLLRDGCMVDVNAKIVSQNNSQAVLKFQYFDFAYQHNTVYMDCNATFCSGGDNCHPYCTHTSTHSRTRHKRSQDTPLNLFSKSGNLSMVVISAMILSTVSITMFFIFLKKNHRIFYNLR